MAEKKQNLHLFQPGWLGDYLDARINAWPAHQWEAPVLQGKPKELVWYRIPLPEGVSGDGSEYHIYLKKGTVPRLCLFFSGGGMAWDAYTAARPTTGGKVALRRPNFYWNNLRPMTELYNIHAGMMRIGDLQNPFQDWHIVVITYATGDLHLGNREFPYTAEDGTEQQLHFRGYHNARLALEQAVRFFPKPRQLLIAGDSAGGFAAPALAPMILEKYYPQCRRVAVFSDSAQLVYRCWKRTVRDTWQADSSIWEKIHSANLTLDCYRALYDQYGDRLLYLYAGSPRDVLLSAYYNDVVHGTYRSNRSVQEVYEKQMRTMLLGCKTITSRFGLFVYPFLAPLHLGGTVHTAVRHQRFTWTTPAGLSLAEWLGRAMDGTVSDANLDLLSIKRKEKEEIWTW